MSGIMQSNCKQWKHLSAWALQMPLHHYNRPHQSTEELHTFIEFILIIDQVQAQIWRVEYRPCQWPSLLIATGDWLRYFNMNPADRNQLLNVVSLSLADTRLQVCLYSWSLRQIEWYCHPLPYHKLNVRIWVRLGSAEQLLGFCPPENDHLVFLLHQEIKQWFTSWQHDPKKGTNASKQAATVQLSIFRWGSQLVWTDTYSSIAIPGLIAEEYGVMVSLLYPKQMWCCRMRLLRLWLCGMLI